MIFISHLNRECVCAWRGWGHRDLMKENTIYTLYIYYFLLWMAFHLLNCVTVRPIRPFKKQSYVTFLTFSKPVNANFSIIFNLDVSQLCFYFLYLHKSMYCQCFQTLKHFISTFQDLRLDNINFVFFHYASRFRTITFFSWQSQE
jgi:hypothetical protein